LYYETRLIARKNTRFSLYFDRIKSHPDEVTET